MRVPLEIGVERLTGIVGGVGPAEHAQPGWPDYLQPLLVIVLQQRVESTVEVLPSPSHLLHYSRIPSSDVVCRQSGQGA